MKNRLAHLVFGASLAANLPAVAQTPDGPKVNDEAMRHFQALVQIDSTDPPGNETRVVEYVKKVLESEGIPATIAAKDPARANLIARLSRNCWSMLRDLGCVLSFVDYRVAAGGCRMVAG